MPRSPPKEQGKLGYFAHLLGPDHCNDVSLSSGSTRPGARTWADHAQIGASEELRDVSLVPRIICDVRISKLWRRDGEAIRA
jgi:hypothetical protein